MIHGALDTFLNIEVFAFIGLLIRLYFKPGPDGPPENEDSRDRS